MPTGRMLKKKISDDEVFEQLSIQSCLLYTWCIPHLDVEGRILADPIQLKGKVVPYIEDIKLKDIPRLCLQLATCHPPLVIYYGQYHKYMQFIGFKKNQTLHPERESPSEIPPPTHDLLMSNSGVTPPELVV